MQRITILGAVLVLLASACAADDPIGAGFREVAGGVETATCLATEFLVDAHDESAEEADHEDDTDAHDESADADMDHDDDAEMDMDAEDVDHEDDADAHDESADADMDHEDDAEMDMDAEDGDHEAEGPVESDVEMGFEIEMSEFGYSCVLPDLPVGTVVAIRFTNGGVVDHEAVVGDRTVQDDAESAMAAMDGEEMEHGHGAPNVLVKPGDHADLIVQFDDPGEISIGCHIPGHWDAGMHNEFQVLQA